MTVTNSRLDPRRPLVLHTRELGRRAGSMLAVRRTVPAPDDLGLELVRVPPGAPVALDLRLESVVDGVLVSGTATAATEGECARCLTPVAGEITVDLQQLYAYPDDRESGAENDEEVDVLHGDLLDLEPALRDAVVLALPMAPLCGPDCRGLCPDCGQRLDDLPADHGHGSAVDPRWAVLAERAADRPTDGSSET